MLSHRSFFLLYSPQSDFAHDNSLDKFISFLHNGNVFGKGSEDYELFTFTPEIWQYN